jgi:peptidoglycan/xylan/chitin deacetylase (PgdA/CDA1 family)
MHPHVAEKHRNAKIPYEIKASILGIILFTVSAFMIFQILKEFFYASSLLVNVISPSEKVHIYIYDSYTNEQFLESVGVSRSTYRKRLKKLESWMLKDLDQLPEIIKTDELAKLNELRTIRNSVLVLPDIVSISEKEIELVKEFVKKGGGLLINWYFGFRNKEGKYIGGKRVREFFSDISYKKDLQLKRNEPLFFALKGINPYGIKLPGRKFQVAVYDPIPLFEEKKLKADALFSNWSILPFRNYSVNLLGCLMHCSYGRGRVVYFSFPFYSVFEIKEEKEKFDRLFSGIVSYLSGKPAVSVFPLLDSSKGVFLSADTEFKFENLIFFSDLLEELNIKGTAYCVASLAEKEKTVFEEASKNTLLEIASHTYTHANLESPQVSLRKEIDESKILLERLSKRKVWGFRPPMEKINGRILERIANAGYKYVFAKPSPSSLFPYYSYGLVVIPRTTRDDFDLMVTEELSDDLVLYNLLKDFSFVSYLNGCFTLSTHTFLLTSKEKISILKKFLNLETVKESKFLTGMEYARTFVIFDGIHAEYRTSDTKVYITISNDSNFKAGKVIFRYFWREGRKPSRIYPEVLGAANTEIVSEGNGYSDIAISPLTAKTSITVIVED